MATILTFRPGTPERDVGDSAARETASAEVIVFPGVRYERCEDAGGAISVERPKSSKTKPKSSAAHRDVLELVE
jgi:hypothetical protein